MGRRAIPSLRRKRNGAIVHLTDSELHHRREFYCGPWGSPQAGRKYAELIGQWEMAGRRWPTKNDPDALAVAGLIQRYWRWAQTFYSQGECDSIKVAWKVLESTHGDVPAAEFGPLKLAAMRQAMIDKKWNRP